MTTTTFRYYGGGTEELRDRTGQTVSVLRELGDDERDREVGRMFEVVFPDGHAAVAFEEELVPPPS
jgi:uncharacterized tellurite resistance protein B-like protein